MSSRDTDSSPSQHKRVAVEDDLPRIPFSLRDNKLAIALHTLPFLITAFFLPLILYFSLVYASDLKNKYTLAIILPLFGVGSIISITQRFVRLIRGFNQYAPIGSPSRWALDFFQWNFILGFGYITALIAAGTSMDPVSIRIASIPLSILMLHVCGLLVVARVSMVLGLDTPFRVSSIAKGEPLKPGVFVIAEDICAIDGNQGTVFRKIWHARWHASAPFRSLVARLDWLWSLSGILVASGILVVVFVVDERSVGFGVGWSVPWLWVTLMTFATVKMAQSALKAEERSQSIAV